MEIFVFFLLGFSSLFLDLPPCALGCTSNADCFYSGECSNGNCTCFPGWKGPNCAALDNQTMPTMQGFTMEGYNVWGSQVIYENGIYHMFASVYPSDLVFWNEWLTNAQIVRATSANPEGPYTFANFVLTYHMAPPGQPEYWDRSVMNPKIVKHTDGTFLLFYTGDTYNGTTPTPQDNHANTTIAQATQRIGLAYADAVDSLNWTRLPEPVLNVRPGMWDERMVTNPAVTVLPNGTLYMVYKGSSYAYPESQEWVCIGVATAPSWNQPFERLQSEPILPCPKNSFDLEDPCVWWENHTQTFQLVVKDFQGTYTHAGYSGMHAYSEDGVHYFYDPGNPLAYLPEGYWSDGKFRHQTHQERPQVLLGDDGYPWYWFFATDTGLNETEQFWNMVVPVRPPSSSQPQPIN